MPTHAFLHLWPWLAAALTGILLALTLPPFELDWLVWVALIPLTSALWFRRGRGVWMSALLGYVAGLIFFWISLSWLTEVTVLGWFIFAFYLALYFAAWGAFAGSVGRMVDGGAPEGSKHGPWMNSWTNLRLAGSSAAAWAALEWLRGIVFTGFGWNGLGVSLFEQTALIQIAEITGVTGISFLIVLVNLVLVITVRRFFIEVRLMRVRPHYDFTLTIALVAVAFSFGVHHFYRPEPKTYPLRVAAVQANIPQDVKWDPAFEEEILVKYRKQTEIALLTKPELLIWPEAATPRPALNDEFLSLEVAEIAAKNSVDFLFGTVFFDSFGGYNSAVLIHPTGQAQVYNKMHLVPFGEYIPFRKSFPFFEWVIGDQVPADFDAGAEPALLELSRVPLRVAALICFEDTLAELSRKFVQRGADLIVVLTNDGWFRESAGSRQHLANSVFRAVEARRPMIRAANTGVTAWIDPLGRVREQLESESGSTFIEGFLASVVPIPIDPPTTFHTKHGELFPVICLFASLLAIQAHLVRSRRLPA